MRELRELSELSELGELTEAMRGHSWTLRMRCPGDKSAPQSDGAMSLSSFMQGFISKVWSWCSPVPPSDSENFCGVLE